MDNGRILKELKELQDGVKNVSLPNKPTTYFKIREKDFSLNTVHRFLLTSHEFRGQIKIQRR